MFETILYAQEAQPAAQGSLLGGLLPIILIFVIFYFLLIRPQQKRQKDIMKMRQEIQKNDKVVTNGGIIGTIYSIQGEEVVLKVDDNVKIRVRKSAIADRISGIK
jgi:preprotein translocase subunit YajC